MEAVQRYIVAMQSDITAVPSDIAATSSSLSAKSRVITAVPHALLRSRAVSIGSPSPQNTTATILVPAKSADTITESGKPLTKASGVKFLRMDGDRAVLEVEAGSYRFASQHGK
jgi:hypothetical protein